MDMKQYVTIYNIYSVSNSECESVGNGLAAKLNWLVSEVLSFSLYLSLFSLIKT